MTVSWEGRSAEQWQKLLELPAVHVHEVVASTNDVGLRLADQGAATLTLVMADHQTSGRGRGGSDWLSSPGSSVLCSLVYQFELTQEHAPGAAPIRVGAAVARAVERLIEQPVGLKWPNDVVIEGYGKIAGVLCEGAFRQQGRGYIVAGIGVNVSFPGDDYTSIADATEMAPTRGAVLQELVAELRTDATRITEPLSDDELTALRDRDVLFHKQVKTESGVVGLACGIAPDGSLQLSTQDGIQIIRSATVRLANNSAYPGAGT